jgi:cobalamin biosynthesis protein CobW
MRQPIPVTIVSGFLGSGKTTLLCGLLEDRQERRLAVLINELGEVSIDGALARASAGGRAGASVRIGGSAGEGVGAGASVGAGPTGEVEVVDFSSGLIAYAGDARFVPTMQSIARRAVRVDHVLIETSGVALPSAAMERLQSPELAGDFVLDATLVVVDTPRLLAGEFNRGSAGSGGRDTSGNGASNARRVDNGGGANGADGDADVSSTLAESAGLLFDQQLAGADVVVLNKIDDLDTDALLAAEEQVRCRAPNIRFLELAHDAKLDVRLALGLRLHQATARSQHFHGPFTPMPAAESRPLGDHGRIDGHTHSGLMAHTHGLTTHAHFHEQDPGWLSFTLRSGTRQDIDALRAALERVAESEPLLRCKGFAVSSEDGRPVLLQGVRTRVVSTDEPSKRAPQPPARQSPTSSELVFIGYHLSRSRVADALSRLTSTVWS